MKTLGGFAIALLAVSGLMAQNRSGFVNTPGVTRGFSSVVFPGGTSGMPGITRTTGSVVYPGGGGPQIAIPAPNINMNFGRNGSFGARPSHFGGGRRNGSAVFAYPVYVGGYGYGGYGYYDPSLYGGDPAAMAPQQPQQPNVTVIMPPQPPPVIINQFGSGDTQRQPLSLYQPQTNAPEPAAEEQPPVSSQQATHFLIAFRDHTIYSAIAYWVDGDTLHYFTSGNTHNQVSLSLVDRELTKRLNEESGLEVKLPPAKE